MPAPSRFTKVKVAIGYLLLLILLFFTLLLIQKEVSNLSVLDTHQILKADTLQALIQEKDQGTLQLLRTLSNINEGLFTDDDLKKIFAQQDSVLAQQHVQYKVVTKQDTTFAPPAKRGLLKRLGDVFAPSKDSAVVLSTTKEMVVDTVVKAQAPSDSLQEVIMIAAQEKIEQNRLQIQRHTNRLKKLNEQTTAHIDSLVKRYERTMLSYIQQETQKQQELRRRSTYIIAGIAMGAVSLALLFLAIIWADITRSNRYRRELEAANKRTSDLLDAREKLMLTITHDFKAPLSSIIGYTDLMLQQPTDNRQKFYLDNMKSSSNHLSRLVNDLLDFHRLESRKMKINRINFSPSTLFGDIYAAFLPLAQEKQLTIHYEISSELSGQFFGDTQRIRQIVSNLMSNALKFTPTGVITLYITYDAPDITITVADTGPGIPPEERELIFEAFTRLPSAQGKEGFGLGLSIVAKLVKLLDGEIQVEENPGGGTRFVTTFPLYPVGQKRSKKAEEHIPARHAPHPKPSRILVIDDDKLQLDLTAAMLAREYIETVCCQQIEELTEYLKRETFDYLLTDVQMPAINGFDLLTLLRASNIPQARTIPVIAVTARSEMSNDQFLRHGFTGFIVKPFKVSELISIMKHDQKHEAIRHAHVTAPSTGKPYRFSALFELSEGDETAKQHIMKSFVSETAKNMEQLKYYIDTQDTISISALAHKLLPLFTLIEASALVALLNELETLHEKNFSDAIREKAETLYESLKDVIAQLPEEKLG